jgi:tRNA (mo5U34)-methyltransferase
MLRHWLKVVKTRRGDLRVREVPKELPFNGYEAERQGIKYVDFLSDDELRRLNTMLHWNSFIIDRHGRRFGNMAWAGKRDKPEIIPDPRVLFLQKRIGLSDEDVLEIGCFEGSHTIGLSEFARTVTAIDARIENVVKTIVRCAMFGHHPRVFKCNVEERPLDVESLQCDIVFHVGVLYHLKDPVEHLFDLAGLARKALLLDTHYARDDEATDRYDTRGTSYRYKKYKEGGSVDTISGV